MNCEVCGRPASGLRDNDSTADTCVWFGLKLGERHIPASATAECYRLGHAREKARADRLGELAVKAEAQVDEWRSRAETAERELARLRGEA
jgi:hypothetical protein